MQSFTFISEPPFVGIEISEERAVAWQQRKETFWCRIEVLFSYQRNSTMCCSTLSISAIYRYPIMMHFVSFSKKRKSWVKTQEVQNTERKLFFLSGTCLYVCNCGFAKTYNWPCSDVLVKLVLGNQWWSTKAVERLFYMHALYTRSPKTQDPVWILTESIATNCCFQSMLLSWIGKTHLKPIASLLSGVILGWMCYSGTLGCEVRENLESNPQSFN